MAAIAGHLGRVRALVACVAPVPAAPAVLKAVDALESRLMGARAVMFEVGGAVAAGAVRHRGGDYRG